MENNDLTIEQLKHQKAVNAGIKSAKTIAEKMKIDPDYAEYITNQRLKALEKARAVKKIKKELSDEIDNVTTETPEVSSLPTQNEDILSLDNGADEYDKYEPFYESDSSSDLIPTYDYGTDSERPKPIEHDEEDYSNIDEKDIIDDGYKIYQEMLRIIYGAQNEETANLLYNFLEDVLAEYEASSSRNEFFIMLGNHEEVIDMIQLACFDSNPKSIIDNAHSIAYIIGNGEIPPYLNMAITEAAYTDAHKHRKGKGNGRKKH